MDDEEKPGVLVSVIATATAVASCIGAICIFNYFKKLGLKGGSDKFTHFDVDFNSNYSLNSRSYW